MRAVIHCILLVFLLSSCGAGTPATQPAMNDTMRYANAGQHAEAKLQPEITDSANGCWALVYIFYGNDRYREMEARLIYPDEWAQISNGYMKINDKRDILVSDMLVKAGDGKDPHRYRLRSHPEIYVHFTQAYDSLYYGKAGKGDEEWCFTYKRCEDAQCSIYESEREAN